MQYYTVYFIWKLLYMFRVVPSPINRSAKHRIHFLSPPYVLHTPPISYFLILSP